MHQSGKITANPIKLANAHLAEVEISLFLVGNTLNLDERRCRLLVALAPGVAEDAGLCV